MHNTNILKNQIKNVTGKRITYRWIVKVYVNMLSPFMSYYVTAAPVDKIHLRTRLSRGFLGKTSSFSIESSKI